MRRRLSIVPLVVWLVLAGCGSEPAPVSGSPAPTLSPSSVPSPAASSRPLGASTPNDAVRALLATGGSTICRPASGPRWSQAAGCPITARLEQRLLANPTSGPAGGADPICRCQNVAPAELALVGPANPSGTAIVRVSFQFQPPLVIQFTTVQQAQGSGWLVDDSFCADPSTSIYATPVRPCT